MATDTIPKTERQYYVEWLRIIHIISVFLFHLHQPVIIVVGYFIIRWDIAVLLKVLLITFTSFAILAGLYWLVIRRVNFLRVIFGMKMVNKEEHELVSGLVLIPVIAEPNRSFSEMK